MDRYLGQPMKGQASAGMFAGLTRAPAGLPMKQIPVADNHRGLHSMAPARQMTRTIALSQHTTQTARSTRSFTGEH